jgi:hypothetical protein
MEDWLVFPERIEDLDNRPLDRGEFLDSRPEGGVKFMLLSPPAGDSVICWKVCRLDEGPGSVEKSPGFDSSLGLKPFCVHDESPENPETLLEAMEKVLPRGLPVSEIV